MSDEKFDAIIVGAGVAGCTAAYVMAKAGLDVLVIERGDTAGSKNMTGGRLYAHSLEKIIPGFAQSAPVERKITKEKISFLTNDSAVTLDYQAPSRDANPEQASWTVLRHGFDSWLMEQAEAVGAQFITGVRVDALIHQQGRVTGVQAGEDVLEANVVVLADGVNSLLGRSIGLVQKSNPHHYAVGVKELISLPAQTIQDRFGVTGDEGAAWLFAGSPSDGLMGGGFLYTNRESISLGLVCGLGVLKKRKNRFRRCWRILNSTRRCAPLSKGERCLSIPLIWYQKVESRCCQNWRAMACWSWVMPPECV